MDGFDTAHFRIILFKLEYEGRVEGSHKLFMRHRADDVGHVAIRVDAIRSIRVQQRIVRNRARLN